MIRYKDRSICFQICKTDFILLNKWLEKWQNMIFFLFLFTHPESGKIWRKDMEESIRQGYGQSSPARTSLWPKQRTKLKSRRGFEGQANFQTVSTGKTKVEDCHAKYTLSHKFYEWNLPWIISNLNSEIWWSLSGRKENALAIPLKTKELSRVNFHLKITVLSMSKPVSQPFSFVL